MLYNVSLFLDPKFRKALTFRWFCCIGEAKMEKINLSEHSYLKNSELHVFMNIEEICPLLHFEQKNITLFNKQFDFGSVFFYNSEVLFHHAK